LLESEDVKHTMKSLEDLGIKILSGLWQPKLLIQEGCMDNVWQK